MSAEIITALVGAASAAAGYLTRQLTARRAEQKQLSTAELSYLTRLQEMLVDSAKRLIEAEAAHTQKIIQLERDRYYAEEELKQFKVEHERTVRSLRMLSDDQDLEIKKYIAEQELYDQEVRRLNGILTEQGIPVIRFVLPRRQP